jgi:hypothetical protein
LAGAPALGAEEEKGGATDCIFGVCVLAGWVSGQIAFSRKNKEQWHLDFEIQIIKTQLVSLIVEEIECWLIR